jgi:hypothetical protein
LGPCGALKHRFLAADPTWMSAEVRDHKILTTGMAIAAFSKPQIIRSGNPNSVQIAFDVTPTPLRPAAMLLAGGVGLLGFFGARKRRKDGRLGATVAS